MQSFKQKIGKMLVSTLPIESVYNGETWTYRLIKSVPITHIVIETVRFDMQLMAKPNIKGIEYQRGTLLGFEIREYLLQRDNHVYQYCGGESGDPILNIDHKAPRAKGGSNRVGNFVVSCVTYEVFCFYPCRILLEKQFAPVNLKK